MSELLAPRQARGISWGALRYLAGIAATIAIGYAAFTAGQGAQGQVIRDHERRIQIGEDWREKFTETNHQFQMDTRSSLSRIEAKLDRR